MGRNWNNRLGGVGGRFLLTAAVGMVIAAPAVADTLRVNAIDQVGKLLSDQSVRTVHQVEETLGNQLGDPMAPDWKGRSVSAGDLSCEMMVWLNANGDVAEMRTAGHTRRRINDQEYRALCGRLVTEMKKLGRVVAVGREPLPTALAVRLDIIRQSNQEGEQDK